MTLMPPHLFGTSGIRNTDDFFTDQFCFRIAQAFCQYLQEQNLPKRIVLGIDIRKSSARIASALIAGIKASGFNPLYGGVVPSPCLNFFAKANQCGGIMVTGSHLSTGQNGIKFFLENRELVGEDEKRIEVLYASLHVSLSASPDTGDTVPSSVSKRLPQPDPICLALYQQMLVSHVRDLSGMTIVLDVAYGTQQFVMPFVFEKAGAKVITLHRGTEAFTGVDTELSEGFEELKQAVLNNKADLGILYDSDGDRSLYVNHTGELVHGDVIGALLAKHLPHKLVGGTIATPMNTSSVVDHLEKKIIRTKVGSPRVIEAMLNHKLKFGFEGNCGIILAHSIYSRDGGIASVLLVNLLDQTGKSLKQLTAELPQFFIEKSKVDCPRKLNNQIIAEIKAKYAPHAKKIEELDGLKIYLDDDTWVLFRPSGNAPEFRVFAEARSKERAKELVGEGVKDVQTLIHSSHSSHP